MAKIYKDLNNVAYEAISLVGVLEMSYSGGNTPQTQRSDGGTLTHYVTKGPISGQFSFTDEIEAAKMASKVAASSDITFDAKDEVDASVTITITNAKTGGVSGGYTSAGVSSFNVSFVADSISVPA
jgi:hypothetical protein